MDKGQTLEFSSVKIAGINPLPHTPKFKNDEELDF